MNTSLHKQANPIATGLKWVWTGTKWVLKTTGKGLFSWGVPEAAVTAGDMYLNRDKEAKLDATVANLQNQQVNYAIQDAVNRYNNHRTNYRVGGAVIGGGTGVIAGNLIHRPNTVAGRILTSLAYGMPLSILGGYLGDKYAQTHGEAAETYNKVKPFIVS